MMDNRDEHARDRDEQVRQHLEGSRDELLMRRDERSMAREEREMQREMTAFEEAEARVRNEGNGQPEFEPEGRPQAPVVPSRVESEVRAALQNDPRIERPELIAVSVDGIGSVELRGAVGTPEQRRAAVHDARRAPGAFGVVDHGLKVHPSVRLRRADDEIRVEAIKELSMDRFHGTHIRVKVHQGEVTLRGYVWDEADAAAAVDVVAKVAGVGEISNQIKVRRAGTTAS